MGPQPCYRVASSSHPFATLKDPISLTPSWVGTPPPMTPYAQVPFLFLPLGIFGKTIMDTLSLPNLTLAILVWYLDPPTPLVPSTPTPRLVLTLVQLTGTTLVPSKEST
jgi:hypothetical protein